MNLLGDFGGFNDATIMIVGFIMSYYSARMFLAEIASGIPYSRVGENHDQISSLKDKIQSEDAKPLDKADLETFGSAVNQLEYLKTPFYKALFYFDCICRRDRHKRVQKAIDVQLEDSLDIRRLFDSHKHLNLLLSLLMTKRQ